MNLELYLFYQPLLCCDFTDYLLTTREAAYIILVVSVCPYIFTYVCQTISFRKPWRRKLLFAYPVYL